MENSVFNWKWNENYLDIKIYKNNILYGSIPKFTDSIPSTINKKMFFLDKKLLQTNTYISDPIDNKAYCEIYPFTKRSEISLTIASPSFTYFCQRTNKPFFGEKVYVVKNNETEILKLIIPKGIFPDKGIIELQEKESNVELLIYCTFYFNTMSFDNDANA